MLAAVVALVSSAGVLPISYLPRTATASYATWFLGLHDNEPGRDVVREV